MSREIVVVRWSCGVAALCTCGLSETTAESWIAGAASESVTWGTPPPPRNTSLPLSTRNRAIWMLHLF